MIVLYAHRNEHTSLNRVLQWHKDDVTGHVMLSDHHERTCCLLVEVLRLDAMQYAEKYRGWSNILWSTSFSWTNSRFGHSSRIQDEYIAARVGIRLDRRHDLGNAIAESISCRAHYI